MRPTPLVWGMGVEAGDTVATNAACYDALANLEGLAPVLSVLESAAPTPVPVLITGESGVGKEYIARALCHLSPRASLPFVAVNLGGAPEELVDSELFGHVRGAFTGAQQDRPGAFATAGSGTLFLDELAAATENTQKKLLRVLEEHSFRPLGSDRAFQTDARVIAATNAEIDDARVLRQDLRYRVEVVRAHVPPLRERPADIAPLAAAIMLTVGRDWGVPVPLIDAAAVRALERHTWPGNVRELRNVLTRCLLQRQDRIRLGNVEAALEPQGGRADGIADLVELLADAIFDDVVGGRSPLGGIIQMHNIDVVMPPERRGRLFGLIPDALKLAVRRYLTAEEEGATQLGEGPTVPVVQSRFGAPQGGRAIFRTACQDAIAAAVHAFKDSRRA